MKFSEESIFVLKNWDIIQKLKLSEVKLKDEFTKYLCSLEDNLKKEKWWNKNLVFEKFDRQQVFISRKEWKYDNEYAIWIGVENFTLETFLDPDKPNAQSYLWVQGPNQEKLFADLLKKYERKEIFKEFIANAQKEKPTEEGRYVLINYLRKYTEEESEEIISGKLLNEIADFIRNVYLEIEDYKL